MSEEKCCVVVCENPLDKNYWDAQYQSKIISWDLGTVSPPIQYLIDRIKNKQARILIPGCGNTYEAEYLLAQGFTNVTVIDIAPTLVANLNKKFANNPNIKIVLGDFFEHEGVYDYIIEQTFFCALPPTMRQKYVWKMHQLLAENGILTGLLFNREFEISPPFGGSQEEYELLFKAAFSFNKMEISKNSIDKRAGFELLFEFYKTNHIVHLYAFEGITCSGCMKTVSDKFKEIKGVQNASMSSDFSEIVIVSATEIPLQFLQDAVAYDHKYKISKV